MVYKIIYVKMNNNKFLLPIGAIIFGLMPFNPPHIIGKVNWILGGGAITGDKPMETMDWIDLFQHGIPLVFGIIYLVFLLLKQKKKTN